MSKFRCRCGTITRDDDHDHGLMMFTSAEFEADHVVELPDLIGCCRQVVDCPGCGRLWVWWSKDFSTEPVEYVRQPPASD
ncbi:hypothetical protein [Nocardia sp. NRRL S-836]|uniref:hypothetical protein n=1 Tax=Nocardia sp. NRRL S-836 TaxID=1519492 RepID=UPI0006AE7D19|nr:hypothetical protein [Nocardia sp. NRRL S-836]KOV79948.1 hypothetical protein ADL03_35225 [Nocardia sp. NRRL S-836]